MVWGRMIRVGLGLVAAVAVAGAMGCNDQPEECTAPAEGDFTYLVDPQLSWPDSLTNIDRTIADATLTDIQDFSGAVDPRILYRFQATGYPRLDVFLGYVGSTLPIEIGETYTLRFEHTQQLSPPAMALTISDAQGIRFLGVNDWRPNTDTVLPKRFHVFATADNYGDLNGDGPLRVYFSSASCDPRVSNTDCYLEITNVRLDFTLGGMQVKLHNGEEGRLGSWIVHVHKAEKVVGKAACRDALLNQNGVSFYVERAGLR